VAYVTCDDRPKAAVTRTRSTSSPCANSGSVPGRAASVKVAEALITLGWFVGMVRLAVAVDAARVPASGVLVAELAAPSNGLAVTVTVVPSGMFELRPRLGPAPTRLWSR